MKAAKGNKVYTIDESQKNAYIKSGFDITDDEGKVIASGAGKTVSYEKYKELEDSHKELMISYDKLEKEHMKIREHISNDNSNDNSKELKDMTVEELTAYAQEKGIDIGNATTQTGILKKIQDAAIVE